VEVTEHQDFYASKQDGCAPNYGSGQSRHNPDPANNMTAIEYIEQSGVPEAMWPNLAEWFGWFEKQGMVGVVEDKDGIAGVALARCIKDGQKADHYVHSEDGQNVFVDLTISSKGAKSLRCLLLLLWERFGPRKRITFNRSGKPRSYSYMKFMRKARV
jgi:hypothetical protein